MQNPLKIIPLCSHRLGICSYIAFAQTILYALCRLSFVSSDEVVSYIYQKNIQTIVIASYFRCLDWILQKSVNICVARNSASPMLRNVRVYAKLTSIDQQNDDDDESYVEFVC